MLRSISRLALQQQQQQQHTKLAASHCAAVAALRSANCRCISMTRVRFSPEKNTGNAGKGVLQAKPQGAHKQTPYETAVFVIQGSFVLCLLGLGVAGCCFFIRDVMPTRTSPNSLFSESLDIVSQHTDVTSRLGLPLYGYGHIHGARSKHRRNRMELVKLQTRDGKPGQRIKYDVKGPSSHAHVVAEVNDDRSKGEFVYLIVQFPETGEVVTIFDNREIVVADLDEAAGQELSKQLCY